jgi:hypothetical protein
VSYLNCSSSDGSRTTSTRGRWRKSGNCRGNLGTFILSLRLPKKRFIGYHTTARASGRRPARAARVGAHLPLSMSSLRSVAFAVASVAGQTFVLASLSLPSAQSLSTARCQIAGFDMLVLFLVLTTLPLTATVR